MSRTGFRQRRFRVFTLHDMCVGVIGLAAAVLLTFPAVATAASSSSAAKLSPDLVRIFEESPSGEHIRFIAVLAQQADPLSLLIDNRRVTREQGRAIGRTHVTDQLKAIAAGSQAELLDYLAIEQAAGRVTTFRGLWIANMIVGWAAPDVIATLADSPQVERIVGDPVVDLDQQHDEVIPAGGRRVLPAGFEQPPDREDYNWNLERIGAPDAWAQGYYGAGIVVGVIDSGVDYTHPDLTDHIWVNDDEIPWNDTDDDFNGYVDDTLGWNFVLDNNDPQGSGSTDHGTRAAGLVAGDGTSGMITGVAPEATIMPLKAAGTDWGNVFEAIEYAIDNGADIVSMSMSQKWQHTPKPDYALWRQVADNELAAGLFHANSAGNEGDELDLDPLPFNVAAPANCPAPWLTPDQFTVGGVSAVLAIGASDTLDFLEDYSSRGPSAWEELSAAWPSYPDTMPPEYEDYPYSEGSGGLLKPDILAPGDDVFSTRLGGGYMTFSGTSAACPHAAGAMALLLEAEPTLTPDLMTMILELSATDWGPEGKDTDYGSGLLDLPQALLMLTELDTYAEIRGAVVDSTTGDSLRGATVTILASGLSDETNSEGIYEFYVHPGLVALEAKAFGYVPDTLMASLTPGGELDWEARLGYWATGEVSGTVTDGFSSDPLQGVRIDVVGTPITPIYTDENGLFTITDFPADTSLTVRAVKFGHEVTDSAVVLIEDEQYVLDLTMAHGLADDFEVDQGWIAGDLLDTALAGFWERCDPNAVWYGATKVQPEDDHTEDPGAHCYITANGIPGSGQNQNDVDGGWATLTSPLFDGHWYYEPVVTFWYWYSNDTGVNVDDTLKVEVSNDDGESWLGLLTTTESNRAWTEYQVPLESFIELSDSMRVRFIAADTGYMSVVEVGVDDFTITGAAFSDAPNPSSGLAFQFQGAHPNPLPPGGHLLFSLQQTSSVKLELFDLTGRCVRRFELPQVAEGQHQVRWDGADQHGRPCAAGAYFARFVTHLGSKKQRVILVR